jgi:hypothetical protein
MALAMCRTPNPKTELTLHESLVSIRQSIDSVTQINSLSVASYLTGFQGVENAIKAPIVEQHGDVPGRFRVHSLVALCHSTGLWSVLPQLHRDAINRIDGLGGIQTRYPTTPEYQQLTASSDPIQWKADMETAADLVDFIGTKVIADCSVFRRLTL